MMATRTRIYIILGLLAVLAVIGTGVVVASGAASSGGASSGGAVGQIDDGAELLDQASISLEDALAAAQAAASGKLGEVDLEMYQGRLVFNVDVGNLDIKVDAADGTVLGQEAEGSDDDPDSADGDSDSADGDSDSVDGDSDSADGDSDSADGDSGSADDDLDSADDDSDSADGNSGS